MPEYNMGAIPSRRLLELVSVLESWGDCPQRMTQQCGVDTHGHEQGIALLMGLIGVDR